MSSMFEHTQELFSRRRPSQRSCPRPTDPRTAMCPREAFASGIRCSVTLVEDIRPTGIRCSATFLQ